MNSSGSMERKNIIYTGIGRAISDLDSPDGELSMSHNIIRDNESMRPIWIDEGMTSLGDGEKLVYIHRTPDYKNFIVLRDGSLYFFTEDNSSRRFVASVDPNNLQISGIGNTLVLTTSEGLHYVLYKEEYYKDLGNRPPETAIRFSLQSTLMESEVGFTMDSITTVDQGNVVTVEDADIQDASDMELAAVNKLISDATNENRIVYPCFVRYAYRMYDGTSYIMQSSPVLLVPNTDIAPVVVNDFTEGEFGDNWKAKVMASKVLFLVLNEEVSEWSDIIQSIDIFMSEQISTRNIYSKTTQIVRLSSTDAARSLNYGWFTWPTMPTGQPNSFMDVVGGMDGKEDYTSILYDDSMKRKDFMQVVRNTSNFYKVRSIALDNMQSDIARYLFEDEEEASSGSGANLSSIVFGERLPDDYQTHDTFIARSMFAYNGRLNISGVKRRLFDGYDANAMVPDLFDTGNFHYYTIYTHIKKDGNEIVVKNKVSWFNSFWPLYLFYPDKDAYRMTIVEGLDVADGSELVSGYVVELTSHPYLNGAVYFNNLKVAPRAMNRRLQAPYATSSIVDLSNKVYTSEINNPYYFPLEGINTVGVGEIKGLASVTKALSQGQFGQFPLYVFSTDGVWAMEVGDNGLYTTIKPISRDVCINGKSITQTDNAVLFVSDKGVMLIDGSNVSCISEMMNGRSFDVSSVSMLSDVLSKENIPTGLYSIHDFMDYAKDAGMAYDYSNNRVLLYKEGADYSYVFSMNSGTWATCGQSVDGSVTDYPDAYIQTGKSLRNLSKRVDYDNKTEISTLIITRPVKFDDDGYKTIYELVNHGHMDRKKGAILLWGSHDGLTYTLIADSVGNRLYRTGGSGYRYYRLGIVGKMNVGDSVTFTSSVFRRKYDNRLR